MILALFSEDFEIAETKTRKNSLWENGIFVVVSVLMLSLKL